MEQAIDLIFLALKSKKISFKEIDQVIYLTFSVFSFPLSR